ncbi:hypothetical protein [Nitrospirillum sp. BR 11828]|uniref:hypothetical protein n=1 Tax=Nitrospirillum sp. BR 11828 TaxID=3104325 RepID=UPI002ACA0CD8|nr:hypothetical protein [Nitrospirillum sp. BR 11828]MDZ5646665.1 hypothetical protein [Nitrospirillum sp. BR 11828]
MSPILVPLLALSIPIVAIVLRAVQRLQDIEAIARARRGQQDQRFRCFDDLERRVTQMERHVTSPEFDLNRKLNQLAQR